MTKESKLTTLIEEKNRFTFLNHNPKAPFFKITGKKTYMDIFRACYF